MLNLPVVVVVVAVVGVVVVAAAADYAHPRVVNHAALT